MRINRFGTFFILIGIGALALFVVSDVARMPDFRFLLWGSLALMLGTLVKWLSPKPDKPRANRFRMLRKNNEEEDI